MRPRRACSAAAPPFTKGFGCVLRHGTREPYILRSDIDALKMPKTPPLLAEIAGPDVVAPSDPALKAALDHAFEEPAEPPFRRTKAVVVVHDGKVIAERYAAGIGVDTPLLGFSMTKSVINALIGDPDPARPDLAVDAGADSGMARRPPARDRGRASDAHDDGPRAR